METPGGYLKREREMRGIALEDVAGAIRLSAKQLEAIEANEYHKLPHPVYVKGFIRAYARYLGLDENDAVLRFEAYWQDIDKESPLIFVPEEESLPAERERPRTPYMVAAVSAGLALFIIAIYLILSSGVPEEKTGKPHKQVSAMKDATSSLTELPPPPPSPVPLATTPYSLDIHAKGTTWIKAQIDEKEPFEVLLREGEHVRWRANRVFF